MRICSRAVNVNQIMDADGTVRICSWLYDGGIIGRLSDNTMEEVYNSPEAKLIRDMHARGDYSNCNPNACPYVANNDTEKHRIEIDSIPRLPESLFLAYENVCNYKCITCTIPGCMEKGNREELEKKYEKIDSELQKILPYVRHLSANGQGELFASRHILKLLSEWKPLSDPSKCSVSLESNGSLFDEEHWRQIENLGRFRLNVTITVMSFEEEVYQRLSGTSLPVSRVIDNLHFVRSLRENGVVNHFEIATVYQEGNFRTLPAFTKRCLEEFKTDHVRLRPFEPWVDPGIDEWLMDVRNADNPFHKEFLKVMEDPVFKDSRVYDWGGGRESGLGKSIYPRAMGQYRLMEKILSDGDFSSKVRKIIDSESIVVYGLTTLGRFLVKEFDAVFEIPYLLDRNQAGGIYAGKNIYWASDLERLDKKGAVVIALINDTVNFVRMLLKNAGYEKVFSIKELVDEAVSI